MGYEIPHKAILTQEQLAYFQTCKTHKRITDYIEALNEAVVGAKLTDTFEEPLSPGVTSILRVLDQVAEIAKSIPPVENSASRFGNPAFRTFYDKVAEEAAGLNKSIEGLPEEALEEVKLYFEESWGNRTRIDYGSGMELNFLCWLICLDELGVTSAKDHKVLVIKVFWRYIEVMRVLQSTYWLEPAGSHGVWGLDDYHFLPFLFGSAQLRGHKYIRPKAIHDAEIVDEYSKHYIYFACIKFINSVKTASLRWHSPMLDDISAVKTWDKVNSGMLKMYRAEVLNKLPVIQHFLFGSILPWDGPLPPSNSSHEPVASVGIPTSFPSHLPRPHPPSHSHLHNGGSGDGAEGEGDDHWGHAHTMKEAREGLASGFGDCCGIPVPSAFGAAKAEQDKQKSALRIVGAGIRPVPFD